MGQIKPNRARYIKVYHFTPNLQLKKKKSESPILLLHCSLSTSVFLGDLISDEEEPNEEAKKPARKNWDLIKAFGCCNCSTTQQFTHWYYLLFFLFLFPQYLLIIFSFFNLYLCMFRKKNNVNSLSSNFLHFHKFHLFIFNRVNVVMYLMCFITHCVNRVKIGTR